MADLWFITAGIVACLAFWVAVVKMPQWIRSARINQRLSRSPETSETASFWLPRFAGKVTKSSLAANDFQEMREAFSVMGKGQERAEELYLVFCWIVPVIVMIAGFFVSGLLAGCVIAALAFLVPRWIIRGLGRTAEHRQNLEAVELCHLTRMLMEVGLSLERVLRVIAVQGRPMMPMLSARIDRFNRLMESGAERSQALNELGDNKRIPVLRSYVVLMKQSAQLGAGVSDSLEQIITEAAETERNRIKEVTNRVGAKMTIIMMIFMMPALFILVGGPALMSIMEVLD